MRVNRSFSAGLFLLVALAWLVPAGWAAARKWPRARGPAQAHAAPRLPSVPRKAVAGTKAAALLAQDGDAHGIGPNRKSRSSPRRPVARAPRLAAFGKARRDPFAPLIAEDRGKTKGVVVLPSGKAGLVIGELVVQGTVEGPRGAVAVVSNPAGHVFFLRVGDKVFDGDLDRIGVNGVEFIEHSRDAFGREYTRRVVKPVQTSLGAKP